MRLKLILLVSALMIGSLSYAQRGARIGYIDMEYILENVPEYQEASLQLDNKVQQWKKDIEKRLAEVDQMKVDLSNERVLLTKELIEEREEEIQLKQDEVLDYQQKRFGPNGDLAIQRRQLVQPVQDQVFNIVQEIAQAKKYDFIFDKSADIVMLFAAERNDISDQVVRAINRAAKRTQATSKKDKEEIEAREALSAEEDAVVTAKEQEIEAKNAERAAAAAAQKTERETLLAERKRVRDSVRAAKKAEFDAKRARLLAERQARKDSIDAARAARRNNDGDDDDGGGL
ncbi:OmpH family outer membrane protein [Gilvibacter sediminis]|uniref:OmpH family outer membrane protein n=1 Tax=Gilvibacter TaxID=379070 RepID=UPI002350730B|nr:OmpH family outer membrane protein [Gilvibacter sediminis]MDC7998764.1 OmpH family outer membrane protein [Gilvibacter sediminis]